MRIVGGTLKGRRLASPESADIRPTPDRVREALFNMLAHGAGVGFSLRGARVLDLFAGTGAMGFEALSRGAASCLFVENAPAAVRLIKQNRDDLDVSACTRVRREDATALKPRTTAKDAAFTLAFADPPYGQGLGAQALASVLAGNWLAKGALVVLEEAADADAHLPAGYEELDRRRYGKTQVLIGQV